MGSTEYPRLPVKLCNCNYLLLPAILLTCQGSTMFRGLSRGRNRRHGGSRQSMGLLLLAVQILQFGVDRIPIVTLVTLLINIAVHLHIPDMFDIPLPKLHDVCISYQGAIVYREYSRLVLSGLYHLTDMHLYYNMASFIYKGTQLEPRLGSTRFASVIGVLLVGSSAVYCALQYCAAHLLGPVHTHSCAAGFSCVLFGLKVIIYNNSPPSHRLFGIPIHMAYWSELIWISIISPNVSFVGHLAGILTGLLMTHGPLNFLLTGNMPYFFERGVRNEGSGVTSGGSHQSRTTDGRYPSSQGHAEMQEAMRRSLQDDPLDTGYHVGPAGYTAGPQSNDAPRRPTAPPLDPPVHSPPASAPDPPVHSPPASAPALPMDVDEIRRRRLLRLS